MCMDLASGIRQFCIVARGCRRSHHCHFRLDLMSVSAVALGCATGLALFVRALSWLLQHRGDRLLSLLTGFMAIALAKLWPWQNADAKVFETAFGQTSTRR